MGGKKWKTHNSNGKKRVVVTKELPGNRWLEILTSAECQVDVCTSTDILSTEEIKNAIIVNTARGSVVDETALVNHCQSHPEFMAALDVFEDEPEMKPGLKDLDNVVVVPHIASATRWTREGMATLAASNVAGILMGYPAWQKPEIKPFLNDTPPKAAPSILNAEEVGISLFEE